MRKMLVVGVLALSAVSVAVLTEWRYSEDMQEHIQTVNADLARAQTAAEYNTGLIGSLQSMTDEADVAREIIDTHEHVHTLKDEVLAMRVKKAVESGITVGGAVNSVIAYWQTADFESWAIPSPVDSQPPYSPHTETAATAATSTANTAPDSTEPSESNWSESQDSDAVTGVVTKYASTKTIGEQGVIVRKRGDRTTEVFVNTGEFLETVDNVESGVTQVAYKFDNGPVIRQYWTLSSDKTSLFYPGNPDEFLRKLRQAKTFAFQYKPADKVPQSVTFDVTGLPNGFISSANPSKPRPKVVHVDGTPSPMGSGNPGGYVEFDYPECAQRDPSLTAVECNNRLMPGAALLGECLRFSNGNPELTQPAEYRNCAVKVPQK